MVSMSVDYRFGPIFGSNKKDYAIGRVLTAQQNILCRVARPLNSRCTVSCAGLENDERLRKAREHSLKNNACRIVHCPFPASFVDAVTILWNLHVLCWQGQQHALQKSGRRFTFQLACVRAVACSCVILTSNNIASHASCQSLSRAPFNYATAWRLHKWRTSVKHGPLPVKSKHGSARSRSCGGNEFVWFLARIPDDLSFSLWPVQETLCDSFVGLFHVGWQPHVVNAIKIASYDRFCRRAVPKDFLKNLGGSKRFSLMFRSSLTKLPPSNALNVFSR